MGLHRVPLVLGERARLAEDVVRYADLADVVEERATAERRVLLDWDLQALGDELSSQDIRGQIFIVGGAGMRNAFCFVRK